MRQKKQLADSFKALESNLNSKDGQIALLRAKLAQLEKDVMEKAVALSAREKVSSRQRSICSVLCL
jgi:hypothetical protein